MQLKSTHASRDLQSNKAAETASNTTAHTFTFLVNCNATVWQKQHAANSAGGPYHCDLWLEQHVGVDLLPRHSHGPALRPAARCPVLGRLLWVTA